MHSSFKTPKELVSWMGAMQAQDYNMSKWAVGVRLPGFTDALVEAALEKGEILRTHLLRPTWHLVAAQDIYWMLDLSAPNIKAVAKSRHNELELTEEIFKKSNSIIEKALSGGKHLTRNELMSLLGKSRIATNDQRAAHIMLRSELDGVVCSGATRKKEQTYALLAERVPKKKTLKKEEALATLAERYFTSHGPATLQDFIWWSGLSITDAKKAVEITKSTLMSKQVKDQTFWFSDSVTSGKHSKSGVCLLPAYDEFIISYKDRRPSLSLVDQPKMISNNGIFGPVIVLDGQAAGIWKRTVKKDKVIIETEFFKSSQKPRKESLEKASDLFARFLNLKSEIKIE